MLKLIRILYTIPNFDTAGSGKALLNLAKHLDSDKFDVHIACKTDKGELFKKVQESGFPIHIFDFEAPMRPLSKLISKSLKIRKKIKEIAPDIIHSFHYNNNYGEALPAKMARVNWLFTKKNMNWGSDGANAWKLRSAFAKSIIIQNTEMAERFYRGNSKTVLIERGINLNDFIPTNSIKIDPDGLSANPEDRIIITVANLAPVKGIEFLINSFSQLCQDFPQWKLWIVGDDSTEYGNSLKMLASSQIPETQISFLGKQSNVRPFLSEAEIFVLPTKGTGEGSPVALIEAMANGKNVIGSDVSGISDQLKNYPDHLFNAEDSISLTQKLRRLMKNSKDENIRTGLKFKALAEKKYSIEREAKEHEFVYENLMGA